MLFMTSDAVLLKNCFPDLQIGKLNAECIVVPLICLTAFPVDAVTSIAG